MSALRRCHFVLAGAPFSIDIRCMSHQASTIHAALAEKLGAVPVIVEYIGE